MGIKDMFSRVRALIAKKKEEREEIPDDETRDKYLRSLRRQKRIIEEKFEKKRLQKEITEHFKNTNAESLVTPNEQSILKTPYNKGEHYSLLKGSILREKKKLLESKIKGVKKKTSFSRKRKLDHRPLGFLGKGSL